MENSIVDVWAREAMFTLGALCVAQRPKSKACASTVNLVSDSVLPTTVAGWIQDLVQGATPGSGPDLSFVPPKGKEL